MAEISRKMGKEIKNIEPEVLKRFESYHWPGNVRELLNAVEHAVNISTGEEILVKHLPAYLRKTDFEKPQPGADKLMTLDALEKDAIQKTLRFYHGNITRASKALGVGRNTLYDKMRKYAIEQ
jgi:transcriptional regulator with PAS, ATPase and Fis domain